MDKRYQVFISSTFRDLKEERQKVLLALQKLNHIPAGMEFFPSADNAPWDVIKRIISLSDYYVLIIGGRYGSMDNEGISYTEREYDLAVKLSIPVLAFLHADPGEIASKDSEKNAETLEKLEVFRKKVRDNHHIDSWSSADELATKVTVGLVNEIASNPGVGWIRSDLAQENTELLTRLEDVRNQNETLRQRLLATEQQLSSSTQHELFAQGNDEVTLVLKRTREEELDGTIKTRTETFEATSSWHQLFMTVAWDALHGAEKSTLCTKIAESLSDTGYLDNEEWQKIVAQFLALDLISVSSELRDRKTNYRRYLMPSMKEEKQPALVPTEIWRLTETGKMLFSQSRAIHREALQGNAAQQKNRCGMAKPHSGFLNTIIVSLPIRL